MSAYTRQFDELGEYRPSVLDGPRRLPEVVPGIVRELDDRIMERRFEREAMESMAADYVIESVKDALGSPQEFPGFSPTTAYRVARAALPACADVTQRNTQRLLICAIVGAAQAFSKSRSGAASGHDRQAAQPILPVANSFGGAHAR